MTSSSVTHDCSSATRQRQTKRKTGRARDVQFRQSARVAPRRSASSQQRQGRTKRSLCVLLDGGADTHSLTTHVGPRPACAGGRFYVRMGPPRGSGEGLALRGGLTLRQPPNYAPHGHPGPPFVVESARIPTTVANVTPEWRRALHYWPVLLPSCSLALLSLGVLAPSQWPGSVNGTRASWPVSPQGRTPA